MRRVNRFMLSCALIALVGFVAIPAGSESGQGTYGVAINKDIMVPMRDGVRLATDVYLPTKDGLPIEGTFPTIMSRTPYSKDGARTEVTGRYYASHGYAFVVQDTRGRFKSDGVWHMLNDDGRDGFDAAHWISKQLWSNGKLGMIGTSYGGGTQHAVALEKAPELVTAIPVDAMSNLGYASMRNGGAFELRFWNWICRNVVDGSRQARDDPEVNQALMANRDNRLHYLANLPLRRGTTPLKIASEYEEWLVEGMSHGVNDEFWIQNNIVDQAESYKDIPLYLVGGWYDSWASNTTRNYGVLSKTLQGPIYLIMGPWIHGQQGRSAHGQVSFGSDAAISDPLAWRLEWYDHWLKGKDNAVGKRAPFKTPVRIFVMGTGDERGGGGRTQEPWRLLARGERVAPGAHPVHPLLLSCRGRSCCDQTLGYRKRYHLSLRSTRSGAHHRRQHVVRRRHSPARCLGSARRRPRVELADPDPFVVAKRRGRFPNRAAR